MKKVISSSLLIFSLSFSSQLHAQEPSITQVSTPPGENDPGAAISPLKKGQNAPFTGVLLSPLATSRLIVDIKSASEKTRIEVDKAVGIQVALCKKETADLKVETESNKKILQAELEAKIKEARALEEQLRREKENMPNKAVWASLGAAGGVAITVLTVFAVTKATK